MKGTVLVGGMAIVLCFAMQFTSAEKVCGDGTTVTYWDIAGKDLHCTKINGSLLVQRVNITSLADDFKSITEITDDLRITVRYTFF